MRAEPGASERYGATRTGSGNRTAPGEHRRENSRGEISGTTHGVCCSPRREWSSRSRRRTGLGLASGTAPAASFPCIDTRSGQREIPNDIPPSYQDGGPTHEATRRNAMALRCVDEHGESIEAAALTDREWASLSRPTKRHLRMPCCGREAARRTSRTGTRFFAHRTRGRVRRETRDGIAPRPQDCRPQGRTKGGMDSADRGAREVAGWRELDGRCGGREGRPQGRDRD